MEREKRKWKKMNKERKKEIKKVTKSESAIARSVHDKFNCVTFNFDRTQLGIYKCHQISL